MDIKLGRAWWLLFYNAGKRIMFASKRQTWQVLKSTILQAAADFDNTHTDFGGSMD